MKRDSRTVDFLLSSQIIPREENSCLLICEELRRRGYSADYLRYPKGHWRKYKRRVKVRIKNLIGDHYNLTRDTYSVVGTVEKSVALVWEQVMNEGYIWRQVSIPTALTINVMCWGEDYVNHRIETGLNPDFLHRVGPIHMDFMRPEFDSLYLTKDEIYNMYDLDPDKKLLFIMGDGCLCTEYRESLKEHRKITWGGQDKVDKDVEYWRKTSESVMGWFENALKDISNVQIVFRVHPDVKMMHELEELERRLQGFHIISDLSIQQWIKISDIVATVRSTSAIEAFFANIPCVVMRPFPMESFYDYSFFKEINSCNTYEDFKQCVIKGTGTFLDPEIIKKYYDFQDYPSYMRICDELEKIYKDPKYNMIWDEKDLVQIIEIYKNDIHYKNFIKSLKESYKGVREYICDKMTQFLLYHESSWMGMDSIKKKIDYDKRSYYFRIQKRIKDIVYKNGTNIERKSIY